MDNDEALTDRLAREALHHVNRTSWIVRVITLIASIVVVALMVATLVFVIQSLQRGRQVLEAIKGQQGANAHTLYQECVDTNRLRDSTRTYLVSLLDQSLKFIESERPLIPASQMALYNKEVAIYNQQIDQANKAFAQVDCGPQA